jgi:hypothetical protein
MRRTNPNGHGNYIEHTYTADEVSSIITVLNKWFLADLFPLANNVEHIGNGTEINGLGMAIHQITKNVTRAQGATYLGPLLHALGIFEWNGKRRGIMWRLAINIGGCDADHLHQRFIENVNLMAH